MSGNSTPPSLSLALILLLAFRLNILLPPQHFYMEVCEVSANGMFRKDPDLLAL